MNSWETGDFYETEGAYQDEEEIEE